MEAQNAFVGHADVLARNISQQHGACRQTNACYSHVGMLRGEFLPFHQIKENEAAAIFFDFDRLRACRESGKRQSDGQEDAPGFRSGSHSGLVLNSVPHRAMRKAAECSRAIGSHRMRPANRPTMRRAMRFGKLHPITLENDRPAAIYHVPRRRPKRLRRGDCNGGDRTMSVRKKLRAIMSGKRLVLMPGAYDGLSARIIEAEGFGAICAGGNAGIVSMLAQPDTGQSNMRDYADHYARICGAVDIPVYVDADTGFGGVNNVRQMVRAFEAAGVSGVFISDQVFPNRCGYLPGKQVIPTEQMLAKIKAALDARQDPDFFIAARTDAAGVDGLNAAIERSQLFMEAGADMAKPMGVDTIDDIKRAIREIGGPHMATLSQAAGLKKRSLEELEAAGVVAATFPSIALFAAAQAVRNVLRILKKENSLTATFDHLLPLDDYYELVGLKAMLTREESYDKAAAALVRKRAAE